MILVDERGRATAVSYPCSKGPLLQVRRCAIPLKGTSARIERKQKGGKKDRPILTPK